MHARALGLVIVSTVACSSDNAAAIDVFPSGDVVVTVMQAGEPMSGVTALFLDTDNAVVASLPTDASGEVGANLPAGGSVTVVTSPAGNVELETWLDVQPGDELAIDLPKPSNVTLDVSVPGDPLATTAQLEVVTSCDGGTGYVEPNVTTTLTVENCTLGEPATVDLTAFANDEFDKPLAAIYVRDVAIGSGETIALADAWQPIVNVPISYTNADGVNDIFASISSSYRPGLTDDDDVTLLAMNGSATGTFAWPSQIATGTRVVSTTVDAQTILSWAPVASSVEIDLGGQIAQSIEMDPTFDPMTRTVSWPTSGSGTPVDLDIISISAGSAAWTVVARGSSPITLPRIPATLIDVSTVGTYITGLIVPAGVTYANVLGSAGYFFNFAGLIDASPTGAVTMVTPSEIPI